MLALAAGAIVSVAGRNTTSIDPVNRPTTTSPSDDRVGIVGPPPPGTAPSGPATGELVAAAELYNSGTWVYADGRIINVVVRLGYTDQFRGYVVRQLSPSGVEAMRSFLLDGTSRLTPASTDHEFGLIVRDGGRLVAARAFSGCDSRNCFDFSHPEEWLPASAWEDPTFRPFIPVAFRICLRNDADLAVLPARAADIFLASRRDGGLGPEDCRVAATSDARTIADALEDAGARSNGDPSLWFKLRSLGGDRLSALSFEPILPHGGAYWTAGG